MKISNATVIVLLCIFIHMLGVGSDNIYYHALHRNACVLFLVCQGLAYLLYPLLGWLADVRFTRYKFVRSSFVLMVIGCCVLVPFIIINLLAHGAHIELYVVGGLSLMACLLALGMFEATAVQFGMDQMLEDPSDKLSTFIQWYYWGSKLGRLLLCFLVPGLFYYYSNCQIVYQTYKHFKHMYILIIGSIFCLVLGIQQIVFVVAGLWLLKHTKKSLVIDQIGSSPWKLVYQVLKYAWQHKCPERRSAFTYWEEDIPPRIDLGKSKYGGPFTTEEVEDTKTFLSVLLLLLPLLGSHLSGSGYSVLNQLVKLHCPPHWMTMTGDPMSPSLLVVVIGIPVYQCVLLPRIQRYLPNMLKRMGVGLVLCLIKEILEFVIKAAMYNKAECIDKDCTPEICYLLGTEIQINSTCVSFTDIYNSSCRQQLITVSYHFLWLIIPFVLRGLSLLLVFMTTLEFICAQAPLRMKGVLVSLWYASQAVSYLFIGVPEVYITHRYAWDIYQSIKITIILISLLAFTFISRRYRYRQRDEVVNVHFLVEEVYERELALAEQYEQEQQADDDLDIRSSSQESQLLATGNPIVYGAVKP